MRNCFVPFVGHERFVLLVGLLQAERQKEGQELE
jgi:hypothetical protein